MKLAEFLGARVTDAGTSFEITRDLYGAFEGAFGGVVAVCCLVAARAEEPDRRPVALDCRFLRGLQAGRVEARTSVIRRGRRLSLIEVRVHDERDGLAAMALASFVEPGALHPLSDDQMVRPGASVTYAEASPFQLRRSDAPIVGTLGPRLKLTDPGLLSTVLQVPWDEPGTAPEAACLVADMAVGPPLERELADDWVPHPNPDLSLRFVGEDSQSEVAGVARLERVGAGLAAIRFEVFSGAELLAVGCASALLLEESQRLLPRRDQD